MKRAGLILLAGLFSLLMACPMRSFALQATGTLQGTVVNGTAGGGPVAGLEVMLDVFQEQRLDATLATSTSAQGQFEFQDLQIGVEWAYRARVVYRGVTYSTGLLAFEPSQQELPAKIAIYEPTTSNETITVSRAHVFITVSGSSLQVGELYILNNTSDRTYVGERNIKERQPTASFMLPQSSHSLVFDDGTLGGRFQLLEGGFADTEPQWPGMTQVMYSYTVDCVHGACDLSRTMPQPISSLNVLVTDSGVRIESAQLTLEGKREAQGQHYLNYVARNLAPGERLDLSVQLPQADPATIAAESDSTGLPWIILGSVAATLALVYPFWRQRIRDSALQKGGRSNDVHRSTHQGTQK